MSNNATRAIQRRWDHYKARVAELEAEVERLRELVPMPYRAGFSDAGCEVPTTYGEAWNVIMKRLEQSE